MSCRTGKVRYESRKAAHEAMRMINKEENGYNLKSVYECNSCSGWHTTSIEKEVSSKMIVDHSSYEIKTTT